MMSEDDKFNPRSQTAKSNKKTFSKSRRSLLKSVSVGAVAATTLSSVGNSSAREIKSKKYNVGTVKRLLNNHQNLLTELANRDILKSNSIESLSIKSLNPPTPNNPNGERVVQLAVNGEKWTEIRITRETKKGGLAIVILVEDEKAYATLNPHDDEPMITIQSDNFTAQSDHPVCIVCPTDDPCCKCVKVCASGCDCACTPSYVYECRCCRLWPIECAANC